MARRLFGTDGVRGVAGELLTAELATALASAATRIAASDGSGERRPQVLVIRDTRESGDMLEAAVAAGVAAAGGDALLGGILPTPAAPLLMRRHGLDLGVVLSASHNPFHDNGIKFFAASGDKLSDAAESAIEAALDMPPLSSRDIGRVRTLHGTTEDYLRELQERFGGLDLAGLRVALDCAHGAAHRVAPEIFRRLGADVTAIGTAPDGRNINDGVGSTHLDPLVALIGEGGHDIGFAYDGDADRVLAVDRTGSIVDGDELIALAARHLRDAGRLPGNGVAVTVMTNYGFHTAMAEAGIEVETTQVGDRYVLEALRERGFALGGEQSGHVIDLGFAPSGDGVASSLLVLEALAGRDLAERDGMEKLPQRLVNVQVSDSGALIDAAAVEEAIERESAALAGRGRVLVRPSGTEPLLRVMAEAPTDEEAVGACERIIAAVHASDLSR
jgi:phosphoglucosamine mutase